MITCQCFRNDKKKIDHYCHRGMAIQVSCYHSINDFGVLLSSWNCQSVIAGEDTAKPELQEQRQRAGNCVSGLEECEINAHHSSEFGVDTAREVQLTSEFRFSFLTTTYSPFWSQCGDCCLGDLKPSIVYTIPLCGSRVLTSSHPPTLYLWCWKSNPWPCTQQARALPWSQSYICSEQPFASTFNCFLDPLPVHKLEEMKPHLNFSVLLLHLTCWLLI